ncbi:MAG TPA: GAF domain-containing protein, partial [Phormidium sp.]
LAAYAYGYYGVLLCGVYVDIERGYKFGQLSVRVQEQFNTPELGVKIRHLFNAFVRPCKDHFQETIEPFQENIQAGIEVGDLVYAFYGALQYCNHLLFLGEPLDSVHEKQSQYLELMGKLKLEFHSDIVKIWRQLVLNLSGKSANPCLLVGESFDELTMLPVWIEENSPYLIFCTYMCKTILLYFFKKYPEAVTAASLVEKYEKGGAGVLYAAELSFYYSLALLANYRQVNPQEKERYLKKVAANQKQMKHWAKNAPANFQHKYDLVEAEKARVRGQSFKASTYYEQAIQGAKAQGYIQEEALANELAGEFHLSLGRESMGRFYIIESYYSYIRWGATAKVKNLEETYPQFLSKIVHQKSTELDVYHTKLTTTDSDSGFLDFAAVTKASLAISGEIVLSQLLNKLMKIAIENAGAQKGCLILNRQDALVIEATGEVEGNEVTVMQSSPGEIGEAVPVTVINYVGRTQKSVVLNDARNEGVFNHDPYIIKHKCKSVLCMPILNKGSWL